MVIFVLVTWSVEMLLIIFFIAYMRMQCMIIIGYFIFIFYIWGCKQDKLKKTLWSLFMDEFQLSEGYSHFEEADYFLPLSSQIYLVLILPTLEGLKAELTWSHPVVLNTRHLDWESSILITRPLPHKQSYIEIQIHFCLHHLSLLKY